MNRLLRNPFQFIDQLVKINKLLVRFNYPLFFVDAVFPLNLKDYEFENTPRVIWSWSQFAFVLDQLYLIQRETDLVLNMLDLSTDSPSLVVDNSRLLNNLDEQ